MKIAYGDSRLSKRWSNKNITFEALVERLSTTRRTAETVSEYEKMTRAQRDAIKDVGGYVLGHLRGGRRKKDTVESRSGITLDADHGRPPQPPPYKAVVYSTHGHTPENPRLRFILPLTRDVTPDEYAAVARLVADKMGMDYFDDSTYEPERLMYWQSTPADGEYFCAVYDGELVDPDKLLAELSDWRDCSLLPTSSRQSEVARRSTVSQQQDPLTKTGVVGAFCRSYTIEAVIAEYLAGIYELSVVEGRYDYVPADSSAGVVVYEGKWAFSHHATDPAYGKLLNAFDLVRMHRFGTAADSFNAMSALAVQDELVKVTLAEERLMSAEQDFANNWLSQLQRDKHGRLLNTLGNLLLILNNDLNYSNIRFNQLAGQVYASRLPWERPHAAWRDADTAQLVAHIDSHYGEFSARNYELALTKVADDRAYHPIREYLDGLWWDGVERVDTLLVDYLGAEDTEYVRAVTRKTMVGAVARVLSPGTKLDSILVLNGKQGIGKSTLFARLGRQWYSDSLTISDMRDKTAPEKLQGYWILEIGELAGLKKVDAEIVKSFITRADDKYRPSYGRTVESHPRQCVVVGTTNSEDGFLRDNTGNRRFWTVCVTGESELRPWDLVAVDQLWAEAQVRYHAGEELYLKGGLAEEAQEQQRLAMEGDDREGLVVDYLETPLPENWEELDVFRRQEYIRFPDDPLRACGTVQRAQVCTMEIWCECFGNPRASIKKTDTYEIQSILKKIGGWEKRDAKVRTKLYGIQRVFNRTGLKII